MKFTLILAPDRDEETICTVRRRSPLTDRIEELIRTYEGDTSLPVLTERGELVPLPYDDIECVSVNRDRTSVVGSDGTVYRSRLRLCELEKRLPSGFIRLSKSALANRTKLVRFEAAFSGAVCAVFASGYREPVSRRCFTEIKRGLEEK